MRDFVTPTIALLVGVATGIYTFQPLILEQLKKDNNLNPKYAEDEQLAQERLGDLTTSGKPTVSKTADPEESKE